MKQFAETTGFGPSGTMLPLTRQQKLTIAGDALAEHRDITFKTIPDIERTAPDVLAAMPIAGTILEPIADALKENGVPTDETVGGVMHILEINERELHHIACDCHEQSGVMAASSAAHRVRNFIR